MRRQRKGSALCPCASRGPAVWECSLRPDAPRGSREPSSRVRTRPRTAGASDRRRVPTVLARTVPVPDHFANPDLVPREPVHGKDRGRALGRPRACRPDFGSCCGAPIASSGHRLEGRQASRPGCYAPGKRAAGQARIHPGDAAGSHQWPANGHLQATREGRRPQTRGTC